MLSWSNALEIWDPNLDRASQSIPLTNSLSYLLRPELFDEKMLLCLSHQGGLLPRDSSREQILSYPVKTSSTLYSDFSALRVLLELERKEILVKDLCGTVWDREVSFWTDLPDRAQTLQNGYVHLRPNFREDLLSHSNRFTFGWDRVENTENTLAGRGCVLPLSGTSSSLTRRNFTGSIRLP